MKLKFKAKTGICPCNKPSEAFIIETINGQEKTKRIGEKPPEKCPYCNKSWDEH